MNNLTTTNNNQSLIVEQAKYIAKSNFIPDHYKNDVGACILAINSSQASGIPIMQIMAGTYVLKGKLAQYGKFAIALVNKKFSSTLEFDYEYDDQNQPTSCQAHLTLKNGKELRGAKITKTMVSNEGWSSNKKWQTMPELMFMYRAGSFFANTYAPEVLMGGFIEGEIEDIQEIKSITKNEADANVTVDVKEIKKLIESKKQEPSLEDMQIIQNEMELNRK